jgi:hypothetical protein
MKTTVMDHSLDVVNNTKNWKRRGEMETHPVLLVLQDTGIFKNE